MGKYEFFQYPSDDPIAPSLECAKCGKTIEAGWAYYQDIESKNVFCRFCARNTLDGSVLLREILYELAKRK